MAEAPSKPQENEPTGNLDALSASEAPMVIDSIERHRIKILAGIALGVVALCGVLVSGQVKKQKHLAAAAAYTSAVSKGEIAALDAVVVNHPGTVAAGNALLSKSDLQIDQGKPEDARATLKRFADEFKDHPRHAQGLFALANVFHSSGDKEMAKSHYERVISAQADGELTPLARIRLGDLALEAGDPAAAEQRYQEAYTLHPGTPFFEYAEEKLALLKVGNPPEVERPAPPAPEPAPAEAATPPDAPKPEGAKPEAPKPEEAKPATPQADSPKADSPKADSPKADSPKADSPKADSPKADSPGQAKSEVSKSDPASAAPAVPTAPTAPATGQPNQ